MQINGINSFIQTNFKGIVKDGRTKNGAQTSFYSDAKDFASYHTADGWSKTKKEKFINSFNMLNALSKAFNISGILPNYDMPGCIVLEAKNPETHKSAVIHQGDYYTHNQVSGKTYTVTEKIENEDMVHESVSGKQGIFSCDAVMDPTAFIDAAIDILPELSKEPPQICEPD